MAAQFTSNPSRRSTNLRELHDAIELMDGISQDGCREIIAIAKLTLAFIERDDRRHDIETVAQAIHAIWSRAAGMENDINCQAGELGCGARCAALD
jgi:hypothetical protein